MSLWRNFFRYKLFQERFLSSGAQFIIFPQLAPLMGQARKNIGKMGEWKKWKLEQKPGTISQHHRMDQLTCLLTQITTTGATRIIST